METNGKILLLNGSPRKNSNTKLALEEIVRSLQEENIDTEIIDIGHLDIKGCTACGSCFKTGKCVFNDIVNEVSTKLKDADGLIIGSPTYYASPNGTMISFLDRLFFSTGNMDKSMKVGASICVARRAGCDTNFDVLNKYFTISNMIIVGSQYWNNVFGRQEGEIKKDEEGMQTLRHLAKNMAFLIKCIKDGKEKYKINFSEQPVVTNFIR